MKNLKQRKAPSLHSVV